MPALASWDRLVVRFLVDALRTQTVSLLTVRPDKGRSIGYDLGSKQQQGKSNGLPYLVTQLSAPGLAQELQELVASDEFSLGQVVVTRGELTTDRLESVLIGWEHNLVIAGVELFRMGSDGSCLYWYNPSDPVAALSLIERHQIEADHFLAS